MISRVNSYWETTKKNIDAFSQIQGNYQTDVTIIGGGFSGLSTAYFLRKAGINVILLEQNTIGWGASGRNAGMLTNGYKPSISKLTKKHGYGQAKELLDMSNDCIQLVEKVVEKENINCSLQHNEGLKLAYKKKHFDALRKQQQFMSKYFNYETKIIGSDDLKQEIHSPFYKYGALLDPNGFSFHPLNYAIGLSEAIHKKGGLIFEKSGVTSIKKHKGYFRIETKYGNITSKNVVLATNGYSTKDTHKKITQSIMPVDSHIITTEPLGEDTAKALLPNNRVASDTKNFLYYFRRTTDHRLLFGGRVSFGSQKNSQNNSEMYEQLRQNMINVFPNLKNSQIDYNWAGTTAFPMDFMPHIGKTKEGMYFLTGYCGHGAAMSTLLGKIISDVIHEDSKINNGLSKLKFNRIPLHSQQTLLLNLAENYMKLKDKIS